MPKIIDEMDLAEVQNEIERVNEELSEIDRLDENSVSSESDELEEVAQDYAELNAYMKLLELRLKFLRE